MRREITFSKRPVALEIQSGTSAQRSRRRPRKFDAVDPHKGTCSMKPRIHKLSASLGVGMGVCACFYACVCVCLDATSAGVRVESGILQILSMRFKALMIHNGVRDLTKSPNRTMRIR